MGLKKILRKNRIIPFNQVLSNDIQTVKEKMIHFANIEDYKKAKMLKKAKTILEKIKIFQENKRQV